VRRLDRAFGAGKLPWVKKAYWHGNPSWFGRGQIQLTHRENYVKFGISNPDDALKPHISAHVAVAGMRDGLFTGRKLSDYRFPEALASPPNLNPRRIVNGPDGSDAEVARFHRQFATALEAAGWGEPVRMVQQPPRTPEALQDIPPPARPGFWARLANLLRGGK
jgi:putative chitinase